MRSFSYVFSALLVGSIVAYALPSPPVPRQPHERRSSVPKGWTPHRRSPDSNTPIPLRFAVAQSNLHLGHDELMRISDPVSIDYGKHWSQADIAKFFAPSGESVSIVLDWLHEEGFSRDRVLVSASRGWITLVNATIADAERLLQTTYTTYIHTSDGTSHIACTCYSLPAHIAPHIDFVTPTVHFDVKVKQPLVPEHANPPKSTRPHRRADASTQHAPSAAALGMPWSASLPKPGISNLAHVFSDLSNCASQMTPACVRALYNIPPAGQQLATSQNSLGIVEFSPQAYLGTDLDLFFAKFEPEAVGTRPTLEGIDGGYVQTQVQSFPYNAESDLDLQYAMALVSPLKPALYQVGDPILSGSFNNFLDAIDGSYCSYDGGDDPSEDSIYPDPYGGYNGTNQCGVYTPTNVISISYQYDEDGLTPAYEQRQCYEYMKLGLQGVTILFSSGDLGVANSQGLCHDPTTGQDTPTGIGFVPSFPAGCPYITSVGATQIPEGGSVLDREVALETRAYSGGGFSNVFSLPSYQASAVANYYANYPPPYTAEQYNNSQNARGYPDISADGANYVVGVNGNFTTMFGTSASTSVVSSVVTLINDARLAAGKAPVGFINPALYANPSMLNDIVSGNNPGCGTDGFTAVEAWDPVTGEFGNAEL